jgi:PAS domain S-box-containing protein
VGAKGGGLTMSIKILVVSDSASDIMIIKNMLSEYSILTASDGVGALSMLEAYKEINLLILDLDMPNMNGFQVLGTLKSDVRFRKVRTIILTNQDKLDDEIKGLKLGAVDYIRRPITDSLKARIDVHVALLCTEQALGLSDQAPICLMERKEIEKALDESERSKSVFLSHLPGLAYRCNYDSEWTMQYVSEGCFNLTGYPPESLLYNRDLSFNELISPEYREVLSQEWERILPKREPFKYEYEIITATGEKKWVLEMGQGVYNDAGEVEALEGLVLDISDRKAIEDALIYNNTHDRLTGLYNRDYLVSLLEKDIKLNKNSKKALIGIDLSMVQLLALNYGFQYSQNLIKKAAEALSQQCSEKIILFQPRENRFIFYVVDYTDKKELVDFSHVIIETLEAVFITGRISGGVGIVEIKVDQDEVDIDLILRKLLIASERVITLFGKNFEISFYDEELETLVDRERDIIEALNIIALDDHAQDNLFLEYQPVMDLKKDQITCFEALARLNTEKLGLVGPLEFIPLAEKTKLIHQIGEKVIIKAFSFLRKLKEHGYNNIRVSINISLIQLLNPDFPRRLFELIKEMQINPQNICIELTETIFISDFDKTNKVIGKIRETGIHVAIDDFGTGYSSLSRETELNADCMKIDKYFVDRLLDTNPNKSITGDIISMSRKLGHCIIAEGVEHDLQLRYLKEHNCDKIQGYLISKPLSEEDAIEFLKKQGQIHK